MKISRRASKPCAWYYSEPNRGRREGDTPPNTSKYERRLNWNPARRLHFDAAGSFLPFACHPEYHHPYPLSGE